MNILLSTDNNYVMPTGVLMHSIGMHNGEGIKYYVLINSLFSEDNKQKLQKVADKYNSVISFFVINDEVTKDLPFGRADMPKHVSIATYYRLFIEKVLPTDIHKILYLDGDMIVRKSLKSLWQIDIDGYALGVVHDMDEKNNISRLPFLKDAGYFNAGMLLINLDYWREHNCYKDYIRFVHEHGDIIVMHDQDVLNCVLMNKVKWVPITYNFQNGFILSPQNRRDGGMYQEEIDSCKYDPAIIHYTVHHKPWHISCFHPYRQLWRNYLDRTEWKGYRFDEDKPQKLVHYIRNFLFRHNMWIPKYDRTEYEKMPRLLF